MKRKIRLIILTLLSLLVSATMLIACSENKTVNEIYNVSYTGTISITELEDAIQAVIKNTKDAVVGVSNYAYSFGGIDLQSTGTGVIYEAKAILKDGSIVDAKDTIGSIDNVEKYEYSLITNEHVIKEAYKIKISYADETVDAYKETYTNEEKDLAILKFSTDYYLPSLEFGDSENLVAGSFVVAIGCPNGLEYMDSASFGIISYVKRYIIEKIGVRKVTNEYIQHDAAMSPGNSGGPLLNLNGEIIGINSMKVVNAETEGMGFAIPANVVKEFIKEYEEAKSTD